VWGVLLEEHIAWWEGGCGCGVCKF